MTSNETVEQLIGQLGAFAKIFRPATADELADAFVNAGMTQVHLNMAALGYAEIPDAEAMRTIDFAGIARSFAVRGRRLWDVSATYNMAHPDASEREMETRQTASFIGALAPLGVTAATLCTGTRDPDNMWRRHPGNTSEAAWYDFRRSLDALLPAAARGGVRLAIEPEPGNVVTGTAQAKRLVAEVGEDAARIGFILDPTNLVASAPRGDHPRILEEAFAELGPRAHCVHAKDAAGWGAALDGQGEMDYRLVLELYGRLPEPIPFIIQDATAKQLPEIRTWLIGLLPDGSA